MQNTKSQLLLLGGSAMNDSKKIVSLVEWRDTINNLTDSKDAETLKEYASKLLECEKITGTSDDYYDFALGLAKVGDYDTACRIIEHGLRTYPHAVDLLAFYLYYGVDSDTYRDNCANHYNTLCEISKERWTWRSYSFSLNYLNALFETTVDVEKKTTIMERMNELIVMFRQKYPNNERVYIAEARLYSTSDPQQEFNILEKAVSDLSLCPRTAYRYSVLLIDQANGSDDYKKAFTALKKALKSTTDYDINYKNVYFLQGLCLAEILQENEDYKNDESVREIYKCFRMAQLDTEDGVQLSANYSKLLHRQIAVLGQNSKISYYDD